ncbi:unnamed protein product [Parnassius apollo]|uniref:(apollo) hypothetical protein n=1 Tax=Parnassius apollo TaxID=110799 RepID=A0A8S3XG57_PARAO|nr:unnamed protein product [Parnassius apollo]
MECQKCKMILAKKGSHFICQGPCEGTFHKGCVKGLLADIKSGRNRIYCNNCEDDGSEEEEQQEYSQDYTKNLKDIQLKLSAIPGFKKQLDTITQSLSMLSDKYDTLIVEHEQSKDKIHKLEKTVADINNKYVYLQKQNTVLEQKLVSRKHNIEIVDVEQLPGENVTEIVSKIGDIINVSSSDIEWARRTRSPKESKKPPPVIVGFKTTGTRSKDSWLTKCRNLSDTTSNMITNGSALNKIYINEDLTKTTRTLLWCTKKQLQGIYKYIWVSNGKIIVKKCEGEKAICVRAESDICDLLNKK